MQPVACVSVCVGLVPSFVLMSTGAEFHAGLALSEEVEDHRPGLHLLASCREHEEEEPDSLQHGGGRDRVCKCFMPRLPEAEICVLSVLT